MAIAVALYQRQDSVFFRLFLIIGAILFLAADQRFVGFDNLVIAADRRRANWLHAFANAVAHEPCRFIG